MPRRTHAKLSPEAWQAIWDAHTDPGTKKSMAVLAKEYKVPKSTIQGVIEAFRKAAGGQPQKPMGRPSKLTKQCVFRLVFNMDFASQVASTADSVGKEASIHGSPPPFQRNL